MEVEENEKDVQTQHCTCIGKRVIKVKSLLMSPTESWCWTSSVTAMSTEAVHTQLTGEPSLFSTSNFEICATAVHFELYCTTTFFSSHFLFSSGIIPSFFSFTLYIKEKKFWHTSGSKIIV